jgi:hypothetical protein
VNPAKADQRVLGEHANTCVDVVSMLTRPHTAHMSQLRYRSHWRFHDGFATVNAQQSESGQLPVLGQQVCGDANARDALAAHGAGT